MRYTPEALFPHTLADGTVVTLRLIRPEDAAQLREGFYRLSPQSRYRRFLAATSELTDEMLKYLTECDGQNHLALVAAVESPDLKEERGVGVGRFVRLEGEPDVAEAAITVVDDFQHRGIGKLLLSGLIEAAAERGIKCFRAEVLANNEPIKRLLAEVGGVERSTGDGTISYDVPIEPLGGAGADRSALFKLLAAAAQEVVLIFTQWWREVRPTR